MMSFSVDGLKTVMAYTIEVTASNLTIFMENLKTLVA